VAHSSRDTGHGRIEVRAIQVPPAPKDLPFPPARALHLDKHSAILSASAELGVTRLPAPLAGPERVMGYCRG